MRASFNFRSCSLEAHQDAGRGRDSKSGYRLLLCQMPVLNDSMSHNEWSVEGWNPQTKSALDSVSHGVVTSYSIVALVEVVDTGATVTFAVAVAVVVGVVFGVWVRGSKSVLSGL